MVSLVFLHFATTTHCNFKFWKIDPPYWTHKCCSFLYYVRSFLVPPSCSIIKHQDYSFCSYSSSSPSCSCVFRRSLVPRLWILPFLIPKHQDYSFWFHCLLFLICVFYTSWSLNISLSPYVPNIYIVLLYLDLFLYLNIDIHYPIPLPQASSCSFSHSLIKCSSVPLIPIPFNYPLSFLISVPYFILLSNSLFPCHIPFTYSSCFLSQSSSPIPFPYRISPFPISFPYRISLVPSVPFPKPLYLSSVVHNLIPPSTFCHLLPYLMYILLVSPLVLILILDMYSTVLFFCCYLSHSLIVFLLVLLIAFPSRMPPIVTYLIPISPPVVTYPIPLSFSSCSLSDSLILLLCILIQFLTTTLSVPYSFSQGYGGEGAQTQAIPSLFDRRGSTTLHSIPAPSLTHSSNIIPKQHASLNSPQRYMLTTDTHEILQRVADYFHHILRNIIPKQHASLNSSQQYMMLTTERQEIPQIQLRVSGFSAIF